MNRVLANFPIIKKISSVTILFIFTLAITPKITLHGWFANHVDTTAGHTSTDKSLISKAGFNCKCDDLVAEGHFISGSNPVLIDVSVVYSFASYTLPEYPCSQVLNHLLRGPPVQFC